MIMFVKKPPNGRDIPARPTRESPSAQIFDVVSTLFHRPDFRRNPSATKSPGLRITARSSQIGLGGLAERGRSNRSNRSNRYHGPVIEQHLLHILMPI